MVDPLNRLLVEHTSALALRNSGNYASAAHHVIGGCFRFGAQPWI